MMDALAWAALLFLFAAPYPLAARLHPDAGLSLRAAVTLALGAGGLSLVMLWEGLLGIAFTPLGVALPHLAILTVAFAAARRHTHAGRDQDGRMPAPAARLTAFTALIAAAVLFNGGYWLFHRDDALGIYRPQAAQIAQTGALIPLTGADSLYRAYPMHTQLLYAYAYLLSGWEHEYLANFVGALLAVGCLPAAYALGEQLRRGAGALTAFLLATTPAFAAWASSGYVDLHSAFYYTLAAVFALRLMNSRRLLDAALAGLMLGLAAWTKNAALVGAPLLGAWLLALLLRGRSGWRHVMAAGAAGALVAAPFYVRNLIGAGFLLPDTAWTDQAERTLASGLVFITQPENYGITGWLALAAGAAGVIALARRANDERVLALLGWTLPFFAVWWLLASYDPRFLLMILPSVCALAAGWTLTVWQRMNGARALRVALLVGALALTARAVWFSVEYKDEILRAPFMDDAAKRAILGREPSP